MADLVVTVPEPTDISDGLTVIYTRNNGGAQIIVSYERGGMTRSTTVHPADFTRAQLTQMQAVMQSIIAAAKTAMGF